MAEKRERGTFFTFSVLFDPWLIIFFEQLCQRRGKLLDRDRRGVDAEVVVGVFAPDLTAVIMIISRAALVDALDHPTQLLVVEVLVLVGFLATALDLGFEIRIDEQAQGVIVLEDIVSASADDDTIGFLRHLAQYVCLLGVYGGVLAHDIIVGACVERATNGNGEEHAGLLLYNLLYVAFGKLCALGDLLDDLFVVIGDSEVFGKSFSKLTAATAKFTTDGDDLIQGYSPFAK